MSASHAERAPRGLRAAAIAAAAAWAIVGIAPLLLAGADLFVGEGGFSLRALRVVLLDGRQGTLLFHSLLVAGGAAAAAVALGVPAGLALARVALPGGRALLALAALPLLVPPLVHAIAWWGLARAQGPLWAAAIFGLAYQPFVTLMVARAFARIDRRLEESARLAGGRLLAARIAARAIAPSVLAGASLVFAFAIADFSVPDYLSSVGPKFNVYADDIFFRWKQLQSSGEAVAASLPPALFVGFALALLLALRRAAPRSAAGFEPPGRAAGAAARLAGAAALAAALVPAAFLPLARLAHEAGGFANYRAALDAARGDLLASLGCAALAAVVAAAAAALPAWAAARRGGSLLADLWVSLPLALPALLLAIGLIRLWNRTTPVVDVGEWVYGTRAIVVLAFLARFAAFPWFAAVESLRAEDPALDDAGALAGLGWGRRFLALALPRALPSLAAGAVLVFAFAVREVDSVALIPAANGTAMFRVYNYVHFGRDALIAALCLEVVFLGAAPILALALLSEKDARS